MSLQSELDHVSATTGADGTLCLASESSDGLSSRNTGTMPKSVTAERSDSTVAALFASNQQSSRPSGTGNELRTDIEGIDSFQNNAIKVCMLGDAGTGKTSIILRLTKDVFTPNVNVTVGASFFIHTVRTEPTPGQFVNVKFEIWDTAGQERYRAMVHMFYRNSKIAIIVYNEKNDDDTLDPLIIVETWIETIKTNTGDPTIQFVILCNKRDIVPCDFKKLAETAAKYNALYFDCSAKTGYNIKEIFEILATMKAGTYLYDICRKKAGVVSLTDTGNTKPGGWSCYC